MTFQIMQKNLKSIASALPDSPACRSDAILLTYHESIWKLLHFGSVYTKFIK